MAYHPMSETVIVAALRNGNLRRAVELLLETYQDELYAYCARLVSLEHAAHVYHLVLATAIDRLGTFEGRNSVRAWMFSIARLAVIHYQRQRPREHPGCMERDYIPAGSGPDIPGVRLRDEVIEAGLNDLEPALREVLQLALWHGLLLSEVAYVTGNSESVVRRLAASGLATLTLSLGRERGAPS